MAMTTSAIDMLHLGRLHADRMADEDEDPNLREGIKYPGKHDVMLGRGGESTYHCGNIAFRQLVEDHKTKYYTCPRAHKSRVVAEVVQKWRQLSPPGRFLTRTNPGAGDKSPWHDVGDGRALKKASHSLRDSVRCFSLEKKQKNPEGDEDAEVSVADNHLKRGRPELIQSSSGKKTNALVGREINLNSIATHKPKLLLFPPVSDERPAKRQRVVCEEREEAEDDCRRSEEVVAKEDYDDMNERCAREESCDRDIPSTISWDNNHTNVIEPKEPAPRLPSPCGSADWFTHHDLPVKPSMAMPPANVLVQEVAVSPSPLPEEENSDDDDDNSLGWFGGMGGAIVSHVDITPFSNAAPIFQVNLGGLHRPVAVPSSSCRNTGRE